MLITAFWTQWNTTAILKNGLQDINRPHLHLRNAIPRNFLILILILILELPLPGSLIRTKFTFRGCSYGGWLAHLGEISPSLRNSNIYYIYDVFVWEVSHPAYVESRVIFPPKSHLDEMNIFYMNRRKWASPASWDRVSLKVRLSPSKKLCVICFIESPLKMTKHFFLSS